MTEGQKFVSQVCEEIDAMHIDGDVAAIAVVIVRKNGHLRTSFAFDEGRKLPLIAGTALLHSEALTIATHTPGCANG